MEIRTHSGADVLERLGPRLDELHAATRAPVTARRPWLEAWRATHPGYEPLAFALVDSSGALAGAALLARRRQRFWSEHVALGTGLSDQVRFPAVDAVAARRLAGAIAAHLRALDGAWTLLVRHLPEDDPVARGVAEELGCAALAAGDQSPTLRFGADRTLRGYVSKNHHQQVRRMSNRLRGEGLEPVIEHLRDPAAIEAVLPEVVRVCLARDVELRGTSFLDREGTLAFFHAVVRVHAARGEVELTTLRLNGELAAYVLCFLDHGAHRMWNCRLEPRWGRYGVGRIANNAALEHALADPGAHEFDWMRGAEAYKLSLCNHVEQALDLRAWSTPAVRSVLDTSRRFKGFLKGVFEGHEWLRPALEASRRVKAATRRRRRAGSSALHRPPR